jgi:hypothetical protein
MMAVTLSPYPSVDLMVVVYRNGAMVLRLIRIYASRPAAREQLLILRDTLRVVATVNFLNVSRNLMESLFSKLPVIGPVVDDIAQGLGAGLLTSAAGHAAVGRCAAFRGWDKEEATETLARQARTFLADVKNIFTKDVLPEIKGRIRAETPAEAVEDPGFWNTVAKGISAAVDTTASTVDALILRPATAGTQGVVRAASTVASSTRRTGARTYRGVFGIFRRMGQRIK